MSCYDIDIFGADPANIKWRVVRGDTATLRVEFLENDEITYFDTEDWSFAATAYDFRGDVLDELEVTAFPGYIDIKASPEITDLWGTGFGSTVAELAFDVQATIDDMIWTPIIGTITVLGDVTPGSL
jgi:hypothetical protein